MSNNIIVVADTLDIGSSPVNVKFYDTSTLEYLDIVSIAGLTDYTILADTLTINPVSFDGIVSVSVTFTGGSTNFSVYFKTLYERDTTLSSSTQNLYPENMFKWDEDNPKYDEVRSLSDLVEEVFDVNGDLIPITNEFHPVFGEYVSNQFLGLAMSMAVQQYINGMEDTEWLTIEVEELQNFSQIANFKDGCTTIGGQNSKGLYPTIFDGGNTLCRLRNGGFNNLYCRYNLTIRVGEIAPARVLPFLTFDSVEPTQMIDVAPVASSVEGDFLNILFRKKNMLDIAGLRANMEVVYHNDASDISDLDLEFVMPAKSKVPIHEYLPISWISNLAQGVFKVAIKFDGTNYTIKTTS